MMMKNIFIGTETVRMGAFYPVQKLYSFLDIPYAVLLPAYLYQLVAQVTGWFNVGLPLTNVIPLCRSQHSVWKTPLIFDTSSNTRLGNVEPGASLVLRCAPTADTHMCTPLVKWWSHE